MTTAVSAYAATSATEPLTKTTINRRDVGPHDVAFDIHFAGICHSDIHTVQRRVGRGRATRWCPGTRSPASSPRSAPRSPSSQVGDRVGVGCFVDSCRECDILPGRLTSSTATDPAWSAPTTASGATASRPRAATAARSSSTRTTCCASPTAIPLDAAAPLLCAGITTYSPLRHWNAGPGTRRRGHRPRRARPHGRQARGRDGRRGDGAQPVAEEDGGRPAAGRRRVLRDQRPRHLREAGRHRST